MPIPFRAILPKALQTGDHLVIKGTIGTNAQQISFNLVQTDFAVALHFKTLFGEGVEAGKAVVLNSKNVTWGQEEFYTNKWQRPGSRDFHFVFKILNDSIRIYDGGSSLLYIFDHRLSYENIQRFEIWHDLGDVEELTFRYAV